MCLNSNLNLKINFWKIVVCMSRVISYKYEFHCASYVNCMSCVRCVSSFLLHWRYCGDPEGWLRLLAHSIPNKFTSLPTGVKCRATSTAKMLQGRSKYRTQKVETNWMCKHLFEIFYRIWCFLSQLLISTTNNADDKTPIEIQAQQLKYFSFHALETYMGGLG